MNLRLIFIVLLSLMLLGAIVLRRSTAEIVPEVHYHAGFLVYINGQLQDYSASQFMHSQTCPVGPKQVVPQDEQIEKAHLHSNVGDVVHVHREGAVWQDLFTNIGVNFPADKPIIGYSKGNRIDNILTYPIKPNDSVIILVGNETEADASVYVSQSHIKEVEAAQIETCGTK